MTAEVSNIGKIMFLDTSSWKPDDNSWVAERKKEWKLIKKNLKVADTPFIDSTNYTAAHESLFFKGEIENLETGGKDFGYDLPLFLMWYHPELNEDVCNQIIEHCDVNTYCAKSLSNSRRALLQFGRIKGYPKEYGFMGGREPTLVAHIYSSRASEIIAKYDHVLYETPEFIGRYCYAGLNCVLRSLNSPWHPGQYLWDRIKPIIEGVTDNQRNWFKNAFKMVLFFEDHPNTCKDDPRAIALRDKLLAEYISGDFPKPMQILWDESKAEGV